MPIRAIQLGMNIQAEAQFIPDIANLDKGNKGSLA